MNLHCILAAVLALTLSVAPLGGCAKRELRGKFEKSKDGQTYLIVADNNGGACGAIFVDEKPWTAPLLAPGLVVPGVHKIRCGAGVDIRFEITAGTVFHFDYWGP